MLERREAKRQSLQAKLLAGDTSGSHVRFEVVKDVGDLPEGVDEWLLPAVLVDVRNLIEAAGDDQDVLAKVRQAIPEYVLRRLGLAG